MTDVEHSSEDTVTTDSTGSGQDERGLADMLPPRGLHESEWETVIDSEDVTDTRTLHIIGPDELLSSFLLEVQNSWWVGYHYVSYDSEWVLTTRGEDLTEVKRQHDDIIHWDVVNGHISDANEEAEAENVDTAPDTDPAIQGAEVSTDTTSTVDSSTE
jgi:hypothetical protein